jgi:hypothetical protein
MAISSKPTTPFVRVEEADRAEFYPKGLGLSSKEKKKNTSPNKVRRVIIKVGRTLLHDIDVFKDACLKEGGRSKATYFVRGAHFYGECLVRSAEELKIDNNISKPPEGLKKNVEDVVTEIRTSLEELDNAIKKEGWDVNVGDFHEAGLVPTASPYQLLIDALFERQVVAEALSSPLSDTYLIQNIKDFLPNKLFEELNFSHELEHCGNGRPTTVFVSIYRRNNGERCLLVGCNKPNWDNFPIFSMMSMKLRQVRLRPISTFCDKAFTALEAIEKQHAPEGGVGSGKSRTDWTDQDLRDERVAREAAKADMRDHDDFLGGRNEVGAAFRTSNWTHMPAYYLCDSTMGYQDPLMADGDRDAVLNAFD